MASFLSHQPMRTLNLMAHIRYATVGAVELSNVHPFCREMWGMNWAFSMNGDVPIFKKNLHQKLTSLVEAGDGPCGNEKFYSPQLCDEIVQDDPELTIMNFLLTCGPNTLWVYSWPGARPGSKVWNGLHYTTRNAPFQQTHLCDMDYTVDFSTHTAANDRVSVIATQPLTDDEEWIELKKGELVVFDEGRPNISHKSLFEIELLGHGLNSTVLEKPVLEEDMKLYNLEPEHFQGSCI
ncbi:MAG: hypothetical protein SGARI_006558 [Bacillariaceae sp.]